MQRRNFLCTSSRTALGLGLLGTAGLVGCGQQTTSAAATDDAPADAAASTDADLWFKISLAEWSLNKPIFAGRLDHLEFARKAREDFGLGGVEYVNQFFADKATDQDYLRQMKTRADDHGVESVLIMIDNEGDLGSTDAAELATAIENHHKWVDAAAFLGCHSIRVNARGEGSREEVAAAAVDGLGRLSEYAAGRNIGVIVENHGGYSSDGSWLAGVMAQVGMDNCGTLPDFGNFCIKRDQRNCLDEYDRYQGTDELMDYAKAVSAKSYDFDDDGNEVAFDYTRLLKIVKDHGYRGWIGIEYEGGSLTPDEGIRKTADLLRRAGKMA